MEAADVALAFDQRHDDLLFGDFAPSAVLCLAADIGFIGFDDARRRVAAKRAIGIVGLHRFTDAVAHEPSSFVGDAEHTLDLLCAHALLAGAKQMIAEQPFVKGNLRAFKDRSEEHTSELQSLMRISSAVFCL